MCDVPALPDGLPLQPMPDKATLMSLTQSAYDVRPHSFDCFSDDARVVLATAVLVNKHGIEITLTARTTPEALAHLRVGESYRVGQGAKRTWRARHWEGVIDSQEIVPGGMSEPPNHGLS